MRKVIAALVLLVLIAPAFAAVDRPAPVIECAWRGHDTVRCEARHTYPAKRQQWAIYPDGYEGVFDQDKGQVAYLLMPRGNGDAVVATWGQRREGRFTATTRVERRDVVFGDREN